MASGTHGGHQIVTAGVVIGLIVIILSRYR